MALSRKACILNNSDSITRVTPSGLVVEMERRPDRSFSGFVNTAFSSALTSLPSSSSIRRAVYSLIFSRPAKILAPPGSRRYVERASGLQRRHPCRRDRFTRARPVAGMPSCPTRRAEVFRSLRTNCAGVGVSAAAFSAAFPAGSPRYIRTTLLPRTPASSLPAATGRRCPYCCDACAPSSPADPE
jgi:hypothetical protein